MKCSKCGSVMTSGRGRWQYRESGLDNVFLENVEIHTCTNGECGAEDVVLVGIERLHEALAELFATKPGRMTGAEAKFVRQFLGFSRRDLGRLLGVAEEVVQRWELAGADHVPLQRERYLRSFVVMKVRTDDYPVDWLDTLDRLRRQRGQAAELNVRAELTGKEWSSTWGGRNHQVEAAA